MFLLPLIKCLNSFEVIQIADILIFLKNKLLITNVYTPESRTVRKTKAMVPHIRYFYTILNNFHV